MNDVIQSHDPTESRLRQESISLTQRDVLSCEQHDEPVAGRVDALDGHLGTILRWWV